MNTNPTAVCRDSAEPAVPGGASSETAAENWAESAMIVTPHTMPTQDDDRDRRPEQDPHQTAQVPDAAIAPIVVAVRPTRSATSPATTHPTTPPRR